MASERWCISIEWIGELSVWMVGSKRVECVFFDKVLTQKKYIESEDEYEDTIISEINNILSSRLKLKRGLANAQHENPFMYGIPDIESLDGSQDSLDDFQKRCEKLILSSDPRLSEVKITDVTNDCSKQVIEMKIEAICSLNGKKIKFSTSC
jgi:predicted component of type VI protein secretion system